MVDLGKHAVFVWASYGAVAIVLGSLIVWLVSDGRRLAARLAAFEARGIKRRSDPDA